MNNLNAMWQELEKHQPIADRLGYGQEWKHMCVERKIDACRTASDAADAACYAAARAARAARAAAWNAARDAYDAAHADATATATATKP